VKRVLFVISIATVAALSALAACKQGQGSRCQVSDDCDSNLVCNVATNTCESTSDNAPQDAEVIDAIPADAAPDAADDADLGDADVDAMPDAP
jgi:hypothetical protein